MLVLCCAQPQTRTQHHQHHSNHHSSNHNYPLAHEMKLLHVSRMQSETCRSSSALKEMLASHQGTLGPTTVLEELLVELRQLHLSHDHVRTSMEAFATTHAEDATKMHESMSSLRQELQRITVLFRGRREELPVRLHSSLCAACFSDREQA